MDADAVLLATCPHLHTRSFGHPSSSKGPAAMFRACLTCSTSSPSILEIMPLTSVTLVAREWGRSPRGVGLPKELFQGAVAQWSGIPNPTPHTHTHAEKVSCPYQTKMRIYRKCCFEFRIWNERKWFQIAIHPPRLAIVCAPANIF
jgi:hypothetical protein